MVFTTFSRGLFWCMGTAMVCLAWMSSAVFYRVVARFLARPVEWKCCSLEPVDSLRPLFKAIVYSRSWVRNSMNSSDTKVTVFFFAGLFQGIWEKEEELFLLEFENVLFSPICKSSIFVYFYFSVFWCHGSFSVYRHCFHPFCCACWVVWPGVTPQRVPSVPAFAGYWSNRYTCTEWHSQLHL